MKKIITVTQSDIEKGKHGDGLSCPIALALKRETGRKYVCVGLTFFFLGNRMNSKQHPMSGKMSEFVARFDRQKKVEPFTFEIQL